MVDVFKSENVLQADVFKNEQGETVRSLVLDMNGHDVQILQYDDSPKVVVCVDSLVKQMDISEAGDFIQAHTLEQCR